jgi:ATP-dependent exoDNAse (exonuclease V) alpha subunit
MLAATRADVRGINTEARRVRQEAGALGSQEIVVGGNAFSTGDRVLFLRNDRLLGVKNGTLGTVRSISDRSLVIDIDDGQSVTVDPAMYPHLTHGYAVTVHKAQGVTADHVLVFLSDQMASREWGYVAGSRHRESLHLYADRSVYAGIAEDLSRSDAKSMAIDELPPSVEPIPPRRWQDGVAIDGPNFQSLSQIGSAVSSAVGPDESGVTHESELVSDADELPADYEHFAPVS